MAAAVRSVRPTCRKAAPKKDRHIRLLALLDTGAGILQIDDGKTVDRYFFAPLASDFGRGFTVEKWADATDDRPAGVVETYHVCLNGKASLCACKGFLRWNHCKHIEGLQALMDAGKLASASAPVCRKPAPCPHENAFQSEDGELCCADCSAEL